LSTVLIHMIDTG